MRRKKKLNISFLQLLFIVGAFAISAFFYGYNCGMQRQRQISQLERKADEKMIHELMQKLYE